jgi:hypothetical protein
MKGYKGFDKNLKCKRYQYEIGKTFQIDINKHQLYVRVIQMKLDYIFV